MRDDPIVEEIRRVRDEYARQFSYEIRDIAADLRKREQEHPDQVVTYPPKPSRKQA